MSDMIYIEEEHAVTYASDGSVSAAIQKSGQDNSEGKGGYKQVKMSTRRYECGPKGKDDKDGADYDQPSSGYETGRYGLTVNQPYALDYAMTAQAAKGMLSIGRIGREISKSSRAGQTKPLGGRVAKAVGEGVGKAAESFKKAPLKTADKAVGKVARGVGNLASAAKSEFIGLRD